MATVISLRKVVEAIEAQGDESESYFDPTTGEIVLVTEEDRRLVEEGRAEDPDLPEWQREVLPKIREALESKRLLRLPNRFEVHDWEIMRQFAEAQEDERVQHELHDAIHGAGAFRMFKGTIRRLGIEEDWYRFHEGALEEIARDWLEEHQLPYK
jgi:hypothetical protein